MLHSRLRPLRRKGRSTISTDNTTDDRDTPHADQESSSEREEDEDAEDIFATFLPHLLPDDAPQFHGDPGQFLRYKSPLYGPLTIMVPHYPSQSDDQTETIPADSGRNISSQTVGSELDRGGSARAANQVDEGRKLFAHFLWSAALVVAQGIEDADAVARGGDGKATFNKDDTTMWNVKGHRVLELGAGAGLPSIISVLASASHVTITDHPSSPAFLGAIAHNIAENIPASLRSNIDAVAHEWGSLESDGWAQQNKGRYSRIIAADCLWMARQHENLVKTFLWFLSDGTAERDSGLDDGRVWVVAGFHTGRAIVARFFETAVAMGMEIESIYERNLQASWNSEPDKVRREWQVERAGEGPENRAAWCVIAVLKRARP